MIEHNLDVIKTADYIVDMGPEEIVKGGKIIAEGKPEEICKIDKSYTGKFFKTIIDKLKKKLLNLLTKSKIGKYLVIGSFTFFNKRINMVINLFLSGIKFDKLQLIKYNLIYE